MTTNTPTKNAGEDHLIAEVCYWGRTPQTTFSPPRWEIMRRERVPCKEAPAPMSGQTISGYGRAIPMRYMIFLNNKWRRVYARCFSNAATLHIGDPTQITVDITNTVY